MLNQFFLWKLFPLLNFFKKFFCWVYLCAAFHFILSWVTIHFYSSSEVSKLHLPVSENENVLGLQVNVHNILWVQVLESHHCSNSYVKDLCLREFFIQFYLLLLTLVLIFLRPLHWFPYPSIKKLEKIARSSFNYRYCNMHILLRFIDNYDFFKNFANEFFIIEQPEKLSLSNLVKLTSLRLGYFHNSFNWNEWIYVINFDFSSLCNVFYIIDSFKI